MRCCTLDQICMTVPAYLLLKLLRDPDPVSHPNFPCQLHISVAITGIFLEFGSSKLKKPDDALVSHIFCPIFLFFAHKRSNCHGITNNVRRKEGEVLFLNQWFMADSVVDFLCQDMITRNK